jgi:hypothetical protein
MRVLRRLLVAAAIARLVADAQVAEPILTKTAIPFAPGSGALKLDYAGGIGQSRGTSQVIPEGNLEAGVAPGLEVLIRFPLLRVQAIPEGPAVIGGGQLAIGARYLLAGSAERTNAISVQAIIEAPTGDSQLVGNATQVMPGGLASGFQDRAPFKHHIRPLRRRSAEGGALPICRRAGLGRLEARSASL